MNVLDQLVFLGQLHYSLHPRPNKRSRFWCEKLQITEAITKKTEDLSKGMQQKIQFIATLLHDPELIIMDEPFSGLDPVNANLLMDALVDLRREGRRCSSPPTAWTRWRSSATTSPSSIAAISSSPARWPRSSPAIPATASTSTSRATTPSCSHPGIESFKRYSGYAEIKLRPSPTLADDAQSLLVHAFRSRAHLTLRGNRAHPRGDLHREGSRGDVAHRQRPGTLHGPARRTEGSDLDAYCESVSHRAPRVS
jgi:ABC-2 type transport system ATP-binding protein